MANPCEECKMSNKLTYWNSLQPTEHQFFKIMIGDFENQLRVPREFKNNFQGELSRTVSLRNPSGNTWTSVLFQTDEDLILGNGWEVFVRDHYLQAGDFVVFRYAGNSSFDVHMFGPSGCEKEDSYFAQQGPKKHRCSRRANDEEEHNHAPDTDIDNDNNMFSDDSSDDFLDADYSGDHPIKREPKTPGASSRKVAKVASGSGQKTPSSPQVYSVQYRSGRREVTQHQIREARKMAGDHVSASKRPFFKVEMKPSHVSRIFTLTVPRKFAAAYLPKQSTSILLRVPPGAKTWEVNFNARRAQYTIGTGWGDFVYENNLELHDYCVFELAKRGTEEGMTVLNVHVYRVVKEIVPLQVIKPITSSRKNR